jgi:hypothetical protein
MLPYILGMHVYTVYITYGERKCVLLVNDPIAALFFILLQYTPACELLEKLDINGDSIVPHFYNHAHLYSWHACVSRVC